MRQRITIHVIFVLIAALASHAQETVTVKKPALPKIHFIFDHPELSVTHYEIDMDANGATHYESRIRGQEKGTTDEGIAKDFKLSSETRDRIFELVKGANNLDGNFDYTKHRIAFTGIKTISLTDEQGTHSAKVVWSENQQIMSLIEVFQGISGTLEEEPVLQRLKRFDRLGLNAELAKMERLADSGWLREINLISGILRDIAGDDSVMSLARKRAEHLLRIASRAGGET